MNCRDRGAGAGAAGRDRQDREGDRGVENEKNRKR